jgi:hypothetical protein
MRRIKEFEEGLERNESGNHYDLDVISIFVRNGCRRAIVEELRLKSTSELYEGIKVKCASRTKRAEQTSVRR